MSLRYFLLVLLAASLLHYSYADVRISDEDYRELNQTVDQLQILMNRQEKTISELKSLNSEKQELLKQQNEIIKQQSISLKGQKIYSTSITILAIAATSILIYKEVKD